MEHLTKTDFIQYLNCPESLWLLKNKKEEYSKLKGEFSEFQKKIINEGYEVEKYAEQLFPEAINIQTGNTSVEETKEKLSGNGVSFLQPSFSALGVFARIDILERLDENTYHIYEVKSSTSIKIKKTQNHIIDASFQKHVMENAGYSVSKISLIYLDKSYRKNGEIIASDLLKVEEITDQVNEIYTATKNNIKKAISFINLESIDENICSCYTNTQSNHCDSFSYFNKQIPEFSIYKLTGIRRNKIEDLISMDCISLLDLPEDYKLSSRQSSQIESLRIKQPIINKNNIKKTLSSLQFPLHFFDYETFASAIPKVDGIGPHKHLVFQVSMHTMHKNGHIEHFEWLGKKMELPTNMLEKMQDKTGHNGTFISWNSPFENLCNKQMKESIPNYTDYLNYINSNMFDLMIIFKEDYIDFRFKGSSSIKKVLPILCPEPELSYKNLSIQDGSMAMDKWGKMMLDTNFNEDINKTRNDLLDYCRLDSLAMVEIYKKLKLIE
jgi:CRISPR/Cas system-associated exonuclease Cas4 (RecB family)